MNFVFLFCSERSGSNLVTSMAGAHPQMCGPPPSHLFRLFGLNEANYAPLENDKNWDAFVADFAEASDTMIGDWNTRISADALRDACSARSISAALEYLYRTECQSGETIVFVKENHSYLIAPFLKTHWPEAKFVHQVRDPRDVAASWVRTAEARGGIADAVDVWLRDQMETVRVLSAINDAQKAFWRYEDLIADPRNVMTALCTLAGVGYDPAMLEFYTDKRVRRNARRVAAWRNLAMPVLADNTGKYQSVLSDEDIRFVELCCGELMVAFGYTLETERTDPAAAEAEITALRSIVARGTRPTIASTEQAETRIRRQRLIERVTSRAGTP